MARTAIEGVTARSGPAGSPSVNEVRLVGRLAATPASRELPSGDVVTILRLVVGRPRSAQRTARAPTTDTVDCAVWTARVRQRAERLEPGSVIEVVGSLRRRFWRAAGGPASRYEVEVRTLRRVPVQGRSSGAAGRP